MALLLALGLAGCHKKKPKTPQAPRAHAAIPAPVGSIEEGLASWYGPPYHGRQAADGEIYNMEKMTAAHRTLPFQTWVRVTNRQNGLTVDVRITDRGPFVEGRIIDLSKAAARRIQLLGPRSETLSNLQLQLLADEEPGATRDEVEAEARREALTGTSPRERNRHPGRKPLPENLRRVTHVIVCKETTCASCGEQTAVIGYDESEQLDMEPAHYFVRVTRREKRACQRCRKSRRSDSYARMCGTSFSRTSISTTRAVFQTFL